MNFINWLKDRLGTVSANDLPQARLIAALSTTEWRTARQIIMLAKIDDWQFAEWINDLQIDGLVEERASTAGPFNLLLREWRLKS